MGVPIWVLSIVSPGVIGLVMTGCWRSPLAGSVVALGLTVLGIAVTAWMVGSSSDGGESGRGPRYDLDGRARRSSLDDPRER